MKKFISVLLVLLIAFSISACDGSGNKEDDTYYGETLSLNIEELKANWKEGELVFANGKKVSIPCSIKEIVDASGLTVANYETMSKKTFAPDETVNLNLVGENTRVSITCKNNTEEAVNLDDTTIVKYSYNNTLSGNRKVLFADTLTPGVTRTDIEKALGEPTKTTSENTLYFYSGKNSNKKKVELRIGFNSDNVVNSVEYEIK